MLRPSQRTIAELAPELASGRLAAARLLDECLTAISASDETLHAMLALDPGARADADRCDAERRAGRLRGPLHGVPVVVKDNIDVAGLPTTSGCRALAGNIASTDAPQVARMRSAGAIVVGKANLSEFAFEIRSRSSLGGDTRNPFAPHVTAGGSSGGTAAAVAAGFAIAGLGTDTGGSIRVPAAYTGLVGLRPTHGLLDIAGVAPLAPSTDTIAPIARSVGDAALLFGIMADRETPVTTAIEGVRVGVLRQAFGTDRAIAAACLAALAALADAKVEIVDPVALPEAQLPIAGAHIVDVEFGEAFDAYLGACGVSPGSVAEILASRAYLADHEPALRRRAAIDRSARADILTRHRALRAALEQVMRRDRLAALLHPTGMTLPGSLDNPANGWAPELAACSGWPALTLNAALSEDGLPIGVELLGLAAGEPVLFALGRAIEARLGPRPIPARPAG